ncbi:disease resistance protein Roq1-like [Solanum stenotomum]|uniref:disease resistance protein Roq1-like n=1 Tax=Solanum stenotomum TaxID=172797 RepID=UPI0020D12330|nr:disease resistance protein Roq1-like [Solanum stenotomum]
MSYASVDMSSCTKDCKYDVFLSFRGEDTRKTFVSHLYDALHRKGIHVFKDDERLETGKSISDELLKAIEQSRIAIVIFSKSYASSTWCLKELAHIIKCRNELDQNVIPIFYDVSPSDVRHQNSPFAEAFSQHGEEFKDDAEKIKNWKDAFVIAGNIAGHDLKSYKDEADCIKKLIDDIFHKSLQGILHFPENLVGMKSQIEEVISLLDLESNDVCFIGIWGMGGIGKTEIASFLHQRLRHQFEADCFLGDVGTLYQKNGLTWLEQVVISKLLREKMTLTSKHEGMDIIKSMLHRKKVLFILDNVNHQEQLECLVGRAEWFGRGSRVILTARDKHLLISHIGDNVYEVQLLPENEALELFSRHAFREKSPKKGFMELSRQVVEYAGGLPLALKVLGSSFYKRDREQWRDRIDRLKKIPHSDILGKLRISFDGLDKEEKRMFLDIACLYNHESRDYVERVFKSCGIHLIGIDHLVEKSLLSIDRYPRILMHNMIRKMGENVAREEYANNRIWLPEEVRDLFAGKMKVEKVESMRTSEYQYFKDEVFKKMQSLQVLKIDKKYSLVNHSTITYLPSSLRWIDWENYRSSSLPENFKPLDLVGLSLVAGSLVKLWPISKKLSNLKYLDLSDNLGLTKTPNFGDIPNLETLILKWCKNLEEVHPSLGHCRMLTILHLKGCGKLKKLPKFVSMESLETLNLGECTSLEKFPKICGDMRNLSKLYVGSPWIRSLPLALCGLSYLNLKDCIDLECIPNTIQNLESLWISGCNTIATLPNSLFKSEKLEKLVIAHCSRLAELPISLGAHKKLLRLDLLGCENLKKLPNSIQMESLVDLHILNCPKLDTFSEINGDMYSLSELSLQSARITELPSSIGNLSALKLLSLVGCEHLASLPKSLCNLNNLRWLRLRGCNILENLPENIGDLQELEELDARETAISQLPLSTTKLGKLNTLKFSHKHSSSFVLYQVSGLSSLTRLHLSNCNILGGLPEDLGSLHSLEYLIVKKNNISCLPKSIKKLLCLKYLNVQFCESLNELPRELPPNLELLYADYHLALKSIRDLLINCFKLNLILTSWCGHEKSRCGTISTNQVDVLKCVQHFLRACIQCHFHQRTYFCISFPEGRVPESFGYQFINQSRISINLNPSWYTDKFMGFSICCYSNGWKAGVEATLICISDPERKHSLKCDIDHHRLNSLAPSVIFFYIPFKTWWLASDNKVGKSPLDYCLFEVCTMSRRKAYWGVRLEYENKVRRWRRKHLAMRSSKLFEVPQKDNAMMTEIGCSVVFEQLEPSSISSHLQESIDHNFTTERGLHFGFENKALVLNQATKAVQSEHESQNVELIRICDSPFRKMVGASRKRKRKEKQKEKNNLKSIKTFLVNNRDK